MYTIFSDFPNVNFICAKWCSGWLINFHKSKDLKVLYVSIWLLKHNIFNIFKKQPKLTYFIFCLKFNLNHRHVLSFLLVSLVWQPACAPSLRMRGRVKKNLSNILYLDCNTNLNPTYSTFKKTGIFTDRHHLPIHVKFVSVSPLHVCLLHLYACSFTKLSDLA